MATSKSFLLLFFKKEGLPYSVLAAGRLDGVIPVGGATTQGR
jgi:hypothetical protein